ncbi:outer membrane beta-barrel protein [Taibaiella koreensis]|uniref:outer membrane beta-barrel protein n=1 Tax=Taibaiella koreensis TaxID=1268548 RepID=UPI000E5A0062|nr:outer membrane beta-barrel protein [Taibaiella koreensis]
MNPSELEHRMREVLDEQEYVPRDAAWEQLKQELHPGANASRSLFLFPAWKAAAAVALVLATAFLVYFLQPHTQPDVPATVAHKTTVPPATQNNSILQKTGPSRAIASPGKSMIAASRPVGPAKTVIPSSPQPVVAPAYENEQPATTQEAVKEVMPSSPAPSAMLAGSQQRTVRSNDHSFPAYAAPSPTTREERLKLGIAANVGKPNLGNFGYNVGLVARRQLGERFFAEATVALASTQVNYSERVPGGDKTGAGVGNGDGGLSAINGMGVEARYVNNILAIGVAPAIGVKATRNISVSVGGDLYKSLNRTLALQQDKNQSAESYSNVSPDKNVSDWDAGIKAQLDYRVWRKLSLNMQYRQGLTPFIEANGKSITNSAFNLGLKYYIGH